MTDKNKFNALMGVTTVLVVLAVFYNVLQEYVMPDIKGYWQRRLYYEQVISKKGLQLHKGLYWKEKK